MPIVKTGSSAFKMLFKPTISELELNIPHHVVNKILRHIDLSTGDAKKGEVQCTEVDTVIFNDFTIEVFYNTLRSNGKTGTQFMRFYPHTATMRCLPVTTDSNKVTKVVMIKEHRRCRGELVQMLPAGGDRTGRAIEVLLKELMEETGCLTTIKSRVLRIDQVYMDDGIFSDQLDLLTIDFLRVPQKHINEDESIKGIVLVPWKTWKKKALRGDYKDIFCTIFASRCRVNKDGRIYINGKYEIL